MFINEAWCVRIQLGLDNQNVKEKEYIGDNGVSGTTIKSNLFQVTFFPGFEYHFKGNDRISPYLGMDLGVGFMSNKQNYSSTTNSSPDQYFLFGFNFVTGVDIFLYRGLYTGVEIGLGMNNMNEMRKHPTQNITHTYEHVNELGFNVIPSIRLGWSF